MPTKVFEDAAARVGELGEYLRPANPIPPIFREARNYTWKKAKADIIAGATVAVIAIPQAIGFALIAGLPVDAVMITVVIGAFVCGFLSYSHHHIFGPTNTISVIVAATLSKLGPVPLTRLETVMVLGFLIGAIQLLAGIFKFGAFTGFISRSVIVAYSTGVAILIITGQVYNLVAITKPDGLNLWDTIEQLLVALVEGKGGLASFEIGVATLLFIIFLHKVKPAWPEGLIAITSFGALSALLHFEKVGVTRVKDLGEVYGSLPRFSGIPFKLDTLRIIPGIMSAALATSLLGMLESISITKGLAARSGQRSDPNQELMAMGAANLANSMFGAMPGSSSFVRSAVVLHAGGKTQIAAIFSSIVALVLLLVALPFANFIPIPSLAALLIFIAWRLFNFEHIRIAWRATRSDAIVFGTTLGASLFLNLDTAIYVGVGASLALFLKKAAAPILVEYSFNSAGALTELEDKSARPNNAISIIHVEGELFFGAADLFQEQVRYLAEDENIKVFVLRMKNARHLDATSVMSLQQLLEYLRANGRYLLISGINPDVERVLINSGVMEQIGPENVFRAELNPTASTKKALLRAAFLLKTRKADVRIFYEKKRETAADQGAAPEPASPADYEI